MSIPSALLQLARSNPGTAKIKQMMNMVQTAQNPQAMMQQMLMNNPSMKQVMDVVNQYGGDADKAFRAVAEQHGINPQDIYDMLK